MEKPFNGEAILFAMFLITIICTSLYMPITQKDVKKIEVSRDNDTLQLAVVATAKDFNEWYAEYIKEFPILDYSTQYAEIGYYQRAHFKDDVVVYKVIRRLRSKK